MKLAKQCDDLCCGSVLWNTGKQIIYKIFAVRDSGVYQPYYILFLANWADVYFCQIRQNISLKPV